VPQVFHRSFNAISKVSLVALVIGATGLALAMYVIGWSPYVTQKQIAWLQPVEFSHEHHAGQLGIDCRYCHTSVENSSFAGIPPTKTCMNCHQEIWVGSFALEPVRASYRTDRSIAWERVHNLPQFVYFDHSIHVKKGVGCSECHGRVDRMPLTFQDQSLLMAWCLGCHRNPEPHLRPRDQIVAMDWRRAAESVEESKNPHEYLTEYNILDRSQLESCSTCHR
jgi:hypothetical protein